MIDSCTELVERWTLPKANYSTFTKSDIVDMNSLQIRQFLSDMYRQDVSLDLVKNLDSVYEFSKTVNAEIKCKWLRLCIKVRWSDVVEDALKFINDQGRMKFVRPIYRDLYGWEEVRNRAIENFNANEKYMMHISAYVLKKDLHLD